MLRFKYLFSFLLIGSLVLFSADLSLAGKFKSKIQQRLNESQNIQYEPYYLETNTSVQQVDNREAQAPNVVAQQGAQRSTYAKLEEAKAILPPTVTPYAIYSVSYHSELEDNVVTVKGEIVFEVFNEGRTQIPLVNSSVGLIDVTVNKGGSFVMNHGGKYHLIMNKRGRYTLDIEYLIKAKREREHGPGSFSVDVIPAPISQFEFSMMEKGVQIFIEPAIKVEQDDEVNKTVAWAVMPNTNSISVRWTKALPKEEIETVELEPKVYVQSATHSSLGGGVIRNQSYLEYSILQSEVSSFRVALPEDVSVLNVAGIDMRDWKVSTKEGLQYLDVFLNFGIKGKYTLNVTYEKNIAEGSGVAQMPWVRAVGVERENGFYGVAASTNVELAVKNKKKVTQIDIKQLPRNIWASSSNPILLAFKYLNHPIVIDIEVTKHEEVPVLLAAIDRADHVTLHTDEGKVLTKVTYQIRNNVKQFLRFKLPQEAIIWSSFVAGKPVKPAKDNKGNILIPLEKSQLQGSDLTRFPVEIVYLDKGSKMKQWGGLQLHMPSTDIPINQSYWSVYLPYDYTYFSFDGDLRPMDKRARGGLIQALTRGGVQGRLRSAVDDIGDQFSPGNTNVLSYASRGQSVQKQSAAHSTAKGILPIKIDIPQQGQLFRFSKLLVVEGESPKLTVRYTAFIDKIRKPIKLIVYLVLIIFIFLLIIKRIKRKKVKE